MKKSGLADSPFFSTNSQPEEKRDLKQDNNVLPERNSERTEIRSEKRTVILPTKRRTKRYSFEFYEDQLTKLKRLKYEAELAGESLTQSDLVREALDLYLRDKKSD